MSSESAVGGDLGLDDRSRVPDEGLAERPVPVAGLDVPELDLAAVARGDRRCAPPGQDPDVAHGGPVRVELLDRPAGLVVAG